MYICLSFVIFLFTPEEGWKPIRIYVVASLLLCQLLLKMWILQTTICLHPLTVSIYLLIVGFQVSVGRRYHDLFFKLTLQILADSLQLDQDASANLNSMIVPCCGDLRELKGGHYHKIVEITENAGKCLLAEYMVRLCIELNT